MASLADLLQQRGITQANPFALTGDYNADLAKYHELGFGTGGDLGVDAGSDWMNQFGAEQGKYAAANPGSMFDPTGQVSAMGGFAPQTPGIWNNTPLPQNIGLLASLYNTGFGGTAAGAQALSRAAGGDPNGAGASAIFGQWAAPLNTQWGGADPMANAMTLLHGGMTPDQVIARFKQQGDSGLDQAGIGLQQLQQAQQLMTQQGIQVDPTHGYPPDSPFNPQNPNSPFYQQYQGNGAGPSSGSNAPGGASGGGSPGGAAGSPAGMTQIPGLNGMTAQDFATMLGIPVSDPRIAQYESGQTPSGAETIQQLQAQMAQNPSYAMYASGGNGSQQVGGQNPGAPGLVDPNAPNNNLTQSPNGGNTYDQNGNLVPGPSNTGASGGNGYGFPSAPSSMQEAPGNYTGGNSMASYFNPAFNNALSYGLDAVRGSYGAGGDYNSGPAMKGISDYASTQAANNLWQPAFQNYMADKGFNYGVDTGDRNFAYQAQLNDQTIPWQQQMQMAQLGLTGTQGASSLAQVLATLQAQNLGNLGQIQGTGTIGGGNVINNAISQMLSGLSGQQSLAQLLAMLQRQTPGTPPAGP